MKSIWSILLATTILSFRHSAEKSVKSPVAKKAEKETVYFGESDILSPALTL